MSIIGKPRACNTKNANTGQATCDTKIQKLTMLLLARDGFAIPASETTSFEDVLAYLQTATLAADPKKRIYPIKTIQGYTENTEAADTIKSGFGDPIGRNEKPHSYEVDLNYLGIGHHKRLRRFNEDETLRAYWVDTTFIGGQKNSAGDFVPFEVFFNLRQVTVGNGADAITKSVVDLSFKRPTALTDDMEQIVFDEEIDLKNELYGCLDVTLSSPASMVVKANISISNVDLYDSYSTQLATPSAWICTDALTGQIVTPTSVTVSATNKGWTFAGLTGLVDVKLVDPTALAALNVGSTTSGGYETEGGVRLGE